MFAEELEGNATKRRQEEARARRRKLKQQQDQKKKAEQQAQQQRAAAASSVANVSANTSANGNGTNGFAATVIEAPSAVEIPSTKEDNKNSAVQNALQQREIRQLAQSQVKAALKIQCFYRMHKSNSDLLQYHAALLQKRLQDLQTLTDLLKQQATEYIPPPATSGALTCQLMFLTRSLPYSSSKKVQLRDNVPKVQQLLELALLPGIFSTDENSNPFLSWLQDDVGQRRIENLIRIALVVSTTPNRDLSVVSTMLEFVNALAGTAIDKKVPDAIVKFGKSRLWHSSPPSTQLSVPPVEKGRREPPILAFGSTLDLVTLLRYNLMFITGGPDPIPKTAEQARQKCIAPQARNQSHQLFQTVVKGSGTDNALRLRFLTEILTVPLLTWKIADVSSQTLLQPLASANSNIKKPFLILLLENFINCHSESLNEGQIKQVLCNDTSLTVCPATPAQSLLANLLQVGRLSSLLNGLHRSQLHFEYATIFYQLISTLVDAIPLATFTSRESVVEWISDGKGHHSPVVLSSVVMEQCRYLLSDSFVRTLFDCAIDDQVLQTEMTLNQKNEKDRKQETLLQAAGVNAASMAAKEARLDRKRGFWNSSSWAQRIKGGVTKMLSSNDGSGSKKADSKLIDATSVSRQLASGEVTAKASKEEKVTQTTYSPALFKVLCRLYGIILARWGGDGGRNYIRRSEPLFRIDTEGAKKEIATTTADNCTVSLLNTIIFSTNVIRASWAVIQSDAKTVADVYAIIDQHKGRSPVFTFSAHPQYKMQGRNKKHSANNDGAAMLFLFVSALSRILIVTDDSEIHEMGKPLPLHQVRRCIQTLKQLLYRACCLDEASLGNSEDNRRKYPTSYFGLALINASARTTRDLYDRSSRRPLAVPKLWLIDDLMEKEIRRCKSKEDYVNLLSTPVLRVCPFLVSFKRRLKLFERIVTADRVAIQGENSQNPFHNNPLKPGIPIRITRGRILEDGLATMNHLGRNMRERLAVQYFNEAGMRETGIDAGGLFKEFWTDLCAIAFDPNYALFRVTEENCMYPNPSSGAAHGSDHIMLFEFLGRILGKALYEGITVGPQFAHFFLSHLRGDYKYLNMLSDLSTMDAQLYNNIMFLKTYDGDAEDLCLTFTVAVDDFGGNREIPLMPNGQNIEVTNRNKQLYIQLVAKYYVVDRIKEQAEAFTRGLREVIDRAWLEIFNEPELQVLISGASEENLDVDDMRAHCRYAGGFTGLDRTTNRFWSVVASLDSKEQADFLRFVTSCERPPPLGFGSLNPPLTIQRVGILRDGDKLPSSSTCFNVLKLPTYSSEKVMKERLLYAIQSGAGFELT